MSAGGTVDFDGMRRYAREHFGWTDEHTNEVISLCLSSSAEDRDRLQSTIGDMLDGFLQSGRQP